MRLYTCRFAPCGSTPRHAIRTSQLVVQRGESVHESFDPHAFAGTRAAEVAILLDHDPRKRAGTVRAKVAHGDWHVADFVLDGPYAEQAAEWIERSGKVSPGFDPIEHDPIAAREPAAMTWHTRARLNEISVLPPGAIGWYAGAIVTGSAELKKSPPPVKVTRRRSTEILVRGAHGWPVGVELVHLPNGLVRDPAGRLYDHRGPVRAG